MISYQIAVFYMIIAIIGGILLAAFADEIVKRRKAKKQYVKGLELENKLLRRNIESVRLISELKGWDLNI